MTQPTTVKHRVSAGRHWGSLLGTALVLWGLTGAAVQADETTLESRALAGGLSTPLSYNPVVSANGRFVAFTSRAINLVANDTNGTYDIFVHDRKTGQTTRVSVDSAGSEGNGASYTPAVSANGRFVVFTSAASQLVAT